MGKREKWNIWINSRYLGKYRKLRKVKKLSISKGFPKIPKNNKYYLKIFSEIGFQKFNLIFKIKILKSTVDTGLHRVSRILIKSEKSPKIYLHRKYDFKK